MAQLPETNGTVLFRRQGEEQRRLHRRRNAPEDQDHDQEQEQAQQQQQAQLFTPSLGLIVAHSFGAREAITHSQHNYTLVDALSNARDKGCWRLLSLVDSVTDYSVSIQSWEDFWHAVCRRYTYGAHNDPLAVAVPFSCGLPQITLAALLGRVLPDALSHEDAGAAAAIAQEEQQVPGARAERQQGQRAACVDSGDDSEGEEGEGSDQGVLVGDLRRNKPPPGRPTADAFIVRLFATSQRDAAGKPSRPPCCCSCYSRIRHDVVEGRLQNDITALLRMPEGEFEKQLSASQQLLDSLRCFCCDRAFADDRVIGGESPEDDAELGGGGVGTPPYILP
jgi:hypothetical protein